MRRTHERKGREEGELEVVKQKSRRERQERRGEERRGERVWIVEKEEANNSFEGRRGLSHTYHSIQIKHSPTFSVCSRRRRRVRQEVTMQGDKPLTGAAWNQKSKGTQRTQTNKLSAPKHDHHQTQSKPSGLIKIVLST